MERGGRGGGRAATERGLSVGGVVAVSLQLWERGEELEADVASNSETM